LRNERRYLELEELAEIDRIKKGERIKRVKLVTNKLGYQYEYTTNRTLSQDMGKKRLIGFYGGKCSCGNWPDFKLPMMLATRSNLLNA